MATLGAIGSISSVTPIQAGLRKTFIIPTPGNFAITSSAYNPIDRFLEEQIAGDERRPDNEDARAPTGLYAIGPVRRIRHSPPPSLNTSGLPIPSIPRAAAHPRLRAKFPP